LYSRWSNIAVVLLWLATMSWLIVVKVLPPLWIGEPPSYQTILEAQREEPPVGWRILWNGRPVGWAVSRTETLPDELAEVRSRVRFQGVSFDDLVPGWVRSLTGQATAGLGSIDADTENVLTLDPLGRLLGFQSSVSFAPFDEKVELVGHVEGQALELSVRSGTLSYRTTTYLPSEALLGSALSPQSRLPGLRLGQTWTVPVYNPLRPREPLEILEARVESVEPIAWHDRMEDAWLVVYRADSGSASGEKARGRLWVRRGRQDGVVLKQEVRFFDSTITFIRLPDAEAAGLLEAAGEP
jgi:hypothetical protein